MNKKILNTVSNQTVQAFSELGKEAYNANFELQKNI